MCALAATMTLPWPLLLASKRIMGQLTVCQESDWRSVLKKKIGKMDKKQIDWKTCMSKIHIVCQILPNSISDCLQEKKEHMKHSWNILKHIVLAVKLWLLLWINVFINDFTSVKEFQKNNYFHISHMCSKDDVPSPKTINDSQTFARHLYPGWPFNEHSRRNVRLLKASYVTELWNID